MRPASRRVHWAARLSGRRSDGTSIARSPTKWRASRDAQDRARFGKAIGSRSWRRPARSIASEFDEGIAEIENLGFVPVYDHSIFAKLEYVAGPAEVRAAAIRSAWRDPSIAGIVAVRGGYGSAQVLPLLDPAEAREARKPFVGYSDLTAVLTFLTMNCEMVAFHGPMLDGRLGRGAEGYDRDSFEKALCRREPMGELEPQGLETISPGEARGMLLGGTLTQVLASIGTPYAFDTAARAMCCFWTKSGNAHIDWTEW